MANGITSRIPLVVAELDGQQYPVSMLGENVNWVRNVRAAGGQAVIIHKTVQPIRLVEVKVSDRAPILEANLRRAPGTRPHFDIGLGAPREEFVRVAPRYPVFRISRS